MKEKKKEKGNREQRNMSRMEAWKERGGRRRRKEEEVKDINSARRELHSVPGCTNTA